MEAALQKIRELYLNEELLQAYKLAKEFQDTYSEVPPLVQEIIADINQANISLEWLSDLDSWDLTNQTDNIATFSKKRQGQFVIRCEMLLQQPIFPVLALFSEVDLLQSWVPILKQAQSLSEPTPFRRVIHYQFNLPWPYQDRDMVVSAVGIPIPQNNSGLVVLRSLHDRSEFLGVQIPVSSGQRITVNLACLNLAMLSSDSTQVSLIACCNAHIAAIPDSLVEYATEHGVFRFMKSLEEQCENYAGSVHEERVRKNPGYYQSLRDRIHKVEFT